MALHGILTGGVVLLASNAGPRLLKVIRDIYPLPLFLLFYRESQILSRGLFPEPLDPLFFRIEQSLFRFQPSIAFSQTLPQTAFAELVYAGYFSFYLMNIGAVVGWVLVTRPRPVVSSVRSPCTRWCSASTIPAMRPTGIPPRSAIQSRRRAWDQNGFRSPRTATTLSRRGSTQAGSDPESGTMTSQNRRSSARDSPSVTRRRGADGVGTMGRA